MAAVIIGLILIGQFFTAKQDGFVGSTNAKRVEFLKSFGLAVNETPTEVKNITIPENFSEVYKNYNNLQIESGFNLEKYKGKSAQVYTYSLENARDFALVLSTRFRVVDRQVGKTKISYYYYDDTDPNKQLETAEEAISYFNKTFGEYPYATYSLVQTGLCFAGMEYPALAMISDELKDEEKPRVIVHETAHQWWYGVVGNNQVEYAWLDEGVAE